MEHLIISITLAAELVAKSRSRSFQIYLEFFSWKEDKLFALLEESLPQISMRLSTVKQGKSSIRNGDTAVRSRTTPIHNARKSASATK